MSKNVATAWSGYFSDVARDMNDLIADEGALDGARDFDLERDEVRLLDYDPDAEIRLVAAALYPYSNRSEEELAEDGHRNERRI